MKTLFWIWTAISSIVTVVCIGKEIAWEMRDYVPPDAASISKTVEYAIAGRNTETVFQHTFSTLLTGDSDLFRITDKTTGLTPTLTMDHIGNISVLCHTEDYVTETASLESFEILCRAAADWNQGYRHDGFDTWIADIIAGSDSTVFNDETILAIANRTEKAITIMIMAH